MTITVPTEPYGEAPNPQGLRDDLAALLNQHCAENRSNTPDHVLAQYVMDCLWAFDNATRNRSEWYGRHDQPGVTQ